MSDNIPVSGIFIGTKKKLTINYRLPDGLVQDSKLVISILTDKSLDYYLNTDFQRNELSKIAKHVKTRLLYQGFLAIYNDINRLRTEFNVFVANLREKLDKSEENINREIEYYETEKKKYSQFLDDLKNKEDGSDFNEYLFRIGSGLIITIFSKHQKLVMLRNARDFEKENVRKLNEAKKFTEGGKEILDILNAEKELIELGGLSKIKSNYEKDSEELREVTEFIEMINKNGNYLESGQEIDESNIRHYITILFKFFDHFYQNYVKLAILDADISFNREKMNFILKSWDAKINLEKEEVARKFLMAEIKYISVKIEKCNLVSIVYQNHSQIRKLRECLENLNKSIYDCDKSLRESEIVGNIRAENNQRSYTLSCGHSQSYYETSISHNFRILNDQVTKFPNDPMNFIEEQKTVIVQESIFKLRKELTKASLDALEYEKCLAEYNKIQKEMDDFVKARTKKNKKFIDNLTKTQESYNKLIEEIDKKDFSFDKKIINPWFGLVFKNCSVKNNGRFDETDRSDFSAVNLDPVKLYNIFFYSLLEKGKVNKEKCFLNISTMIHEINKSKLINFDDLGELVFHPRIYGCLKNNEGNAQEFIDFIRTEEVSNSLFSLINETVELMVCRIMMKLELNNGYTVEKLKELTNFYIETLDKNGYRSLAKKIKDFKVSKKAIKVKKTKK